VSPRTAFAAVAVAALVAALAAPGTGAEPQVNLYSEIEASWEAGADALVLTQRSGGAVVAGEGGIGLRGSFAVERGLVMSGEAETGTALEGALDLEVALGPDTVLRGGFALRHAEERRSLVLPGQLVSAISPTLELSGTLGLRQRFGLTLLDIELGQISQRPGASVFPGLPLLPERLRAETDMLRAAFSIEHAVAPTLALLARLEADRLSVGPIDSLLYGRLPADRLRASAGVAARFPDGLQGELRLGADLVATPLLEGERFIRPYGYGTIGMALRQGFSISLTAQMGTAFEDAADGFADWRWRVGAEAEMRLTTRLALAAGLYASGGEAVLAAIPLASELGAEAGFTYALAPGLLLRTRLGLERQTDIAGIETDTLALAVSLRAEI